MLENEPFESLPVPCRPLPKVDHYPPILSFGFAIPNHVAEFRRAALNHKLGNPEELSTTKDSALLRLLVKSYLNERCDLPPGQGIVYGHIHSRESNLVIEIATNYRSRITRDNLAGVLRSIREVFSLPDDAQPKWYLEPNIVEKDPEEYYLPSKPTVSTTMWLIV